MKVRVSDLQNQTGTPYPRPELHCSRCGESYSADRSDYFMSRPDRVFTCCGRPMQLVTRHEVLVPVEVNQ